MWKNGKCIIKIGGDQSPPLLCVQCIPFLLLPPPPPPPPQPPPLPEFNVMELVNAFPSFPPPPLCGPCKYIIITQVPLPLPPTMDGRSPPTPPSNPPPP